MRLSPLRLVPYPGSATADEIEAEESAAVAAAFAGAPASEVEDAPDTAAVMKRRYAIAAIPSDLGADR